MDSGRSIVAFIWILIIGVGGITAITKANAMSSGDFRAMVKSNHIKIKDNIESLSTSLNADGYHCEYSDSYGGYAECYVNINKEIKKFTCTGKSGCDLW